jgi:hypothetical protein
MERSFEESPQGLPFNDSEFFQGLQWMTITGFRTRGSSKGTHPHNVFSSSSSFGSKEQSPLSVKAEEESSYHKVSFQIPCLFLQPSNQMIKGIGGQQQYIRPSVH